MFVKNKEAYAIKRFLHLNKGITMPFEVKGIHPTLNIDNYVVHKFLKTLVSKCHVKKIGNWKHAWYFVTEEGDEILRSEVGLPDENIEREDNIKN